MTYTILREGLYTESFDKYLNIHDVSRSPQEILLPPGDNDGLIGFTHRDALGEATAKIIKSLVVQGIKDNEFTNQTILLSAEPKYSLRTLADLVSDLLGKRDAVKIKYISVDDYAGPESEASKIWGGPEKARAWASTYAAIGNGETSFTGEGSRELERILGRKPEAVEVTVARILTLKSQ